MPAWSLVLIAPLGVILLIVIIGAVRFLWRRLHRSIPTVTTAGGATQVTPTSATLNGNITDTGGENPEVHIYWGRTDAGKNPANWEHDENLGQRGIGQFSLPIANLTPGTPYFYRAVATNSKGPAWAPTSVHFTTLALAPRPPIEVLRQENDHMEQLLEQMRQEHLAQTGQGNQAVGITPQQVARAQREAERLRGRAQEIREQRDLAQEHLRAAEIRQMLVAELDEQEEATTRAVVQADVLEEYGMAMQRGQSMIDLQAIQQEFREGAEDLKAAAKEILELKTKICNQDNAIKKLQATITQMEAQGSRAQAEVREDVQAFRSARQGLQQARTGEPEGQEPDLFSSITLQLDVDEDKAVGQANVGALTQEFTSLSNQVLQFLKGNPPGCNLYSIERHFAIDRDLSARIVKHLMDERKVERRDGRYFTT